MCDHNQEARKQGFGDGDKKKVDHKHSKWTIMKREDDDNICSSLSDESSAEESSNSSASWDSSDLMEDASSSGSSSSSSSLSNNGPLYELSSLMTHLPIKRGLSKFYQGKSQSFTSLARVESIEDLAKKENPYRKRMKTCKSYGGDLDGHNKAYSPKATIHKKGSMRRSFSSLLGKKNASMGSFPPPPIPVQKSF